MRDNAPASPPARGNANPPQRNAPPQRTQQQAPPQRNGGGGSQGNYDNFKLPPPGKAVFAWAKSHEKTFNGPVVKEMDAIAKEFGFPSEFVKWDEEQILYVCWAVIDVIKGWQTYRGEFDHLEDTRVPFNPQ